MTERHTTWLLALLLVAQLALVSTQASTSGHRSTLLERTALRLVSPLAWAVDRALDLPRELTASLRNRSALLRDNRRLRRQVEELRLEMLRLQGLEGEVDRLAEALDYRRRLEGAELGVADVLYADHSSRLRTLLIHTGDPSVRPNQPVVAPAGLVGRVITVSGPYAKVQLLTDGAASAGAMIERTRRQGVVRGRSGDGLAGQTLSLELVPLQAEVRLGDRVLTSGVDGVFPRGIPVGTVVTFDPPSDLFHRIRVRPAVDFGTLDQVYLLPPLSPPQHLLPEDQGARP